MKRASADPEGWLFWTLFVLMLALGVVAVIVIDGRRFDALEDAKRRFIEEQREYLGLTFAFPGARPQGGGVMRAPVDFECEGCGLLLDPSFEVGRADCAAGCGEEAWVCLSCERELGGVPCGSCEPAWRARREAREEERLAELDEEILSKLRTLP